MNSNDLQLMRNEIEILKICQHPNLVKIYDVYENSECIYIFLEHCSEDLFKHLEKNKFKISEKVSALYTIQILKGIKYLHDYGIVHRDLKPENILVSIDSNGKVTLKISDFGLSKIIGTNEVCSEPYGTIGYVAPEVLLSKEYNKKVDIWSLGIISYLLLVGFLPFDHKLNAEIADKTVKMKTPFPFSHWKGITDPAKEFVDACLVKDSFKRFDINDCLNHPWIQNFLKEEEFLY